MVYRSTHPQRAESPAPPAFNAHPAFMIVTIPRGSTSLFRWALHEAARTIPAPHGFTRCPGWAMGNRVKRSDRAPVTRTYWVDPRAWPTITRVFTTWRLPPPQTLREAQENAA